MFLQCSKDTVEASNLLDFLLYGREFVAVMNRVFVEGVAISRARINPVNPLYSCLGVPG